MEEDEEIAQQLGNEESHGLIINGNSLGLDDDFDEV
jgi:hypothetical protein